MEWIGKLNLDCVYSRIGLEYDEFTEDVMVLGYFFRYSKIFGNSTVSI